MAGSTFGHLFRVTTAGESHGAGQVVLVDGCPPGVSFSLDELRAELARRRPGQSEIVSGRDEPDEPEILSGWLDGRTTGTTIAILVRNRDARPRDYEALRDVYRPGHADFSYEARYGVRDVRGGGRASARETVARVAGGAIAKRLIASAFGGEVLGYVTSVGDVLATVGDAVSLAEVERLGDGSANVVRCPDHAAARRMIALIEQVRSDGDSIGGTAEVVAKNVPPGLGEPVFDKLKASLAHALFSIPAVVGVEYGDGFAAAGRRGSEHNDAFVADADGSIGTATNRHGGILGGISTGMPIRVRAAVKPASSIARPQATVDRAGRDAVVSTRGRHDPCLLPRFVPVAEAMVALVLADHWLRLSAIRGAHAGDARGSRATAAHEMATVGEVRHDARGDEPGRALDREE